tara:strand:- start:229 stop:435 length:207 start_codon:yes stop_codon:yes gene_type:complete
MADPVQEAKTAARAEDKVTQEGVTSLTGKALEGDALTKFSKVYEKSPMIRANYNADGTLKADTKKLTE